MDDHELEELRARALANYVPTPPERWAALFVALPVGDALFVTSTDIMLEDTLERFWDSVADWVWVDLTWWCEDRRLDPQTFAADMRPLLCWLDAPHGLLLPIGLERYAQTLQAADGQDKLFAFIDGNTPFERVREALRERFAAVYGRALPPGLALDSV